jgi:hypothetical protein
VRHADRPAMNCQRTAWPNDFGLGLAMTVEIFLLSGWIPANGTRE